MSRFYQQQLPADDHLAGGTDPMDLKDRLRDVETDCCDLFAWIASLSRGSLNSAHIHGTRVPVEEPVHSIESRHASACGFTQSGNGVSPSAARRERFSFLTFESAGYLLPAIG